MDRLDHLFRRESGRMIATVSRIFGLHNLALAEDVVQDAFCRAVEVWKVKGMPPNPAAWLMTTAKNRALDVMRRERTARTFAPEVAELIKSEWTIAPAIEEAFSPHMIKDDQLRLMFSCCHQGVAEEGQVALMLHLLCGFSVDEIAAAFLSSHASIEKRITRAKKVLALSQKLFDISAPEEFQERLPAVQRAIYLLFNEGYHGASPNSAVRAELCQEAIRLAKIILDYPFGATPSSFALASLMCLHAARLPGRIGTSGELISLLDQDRSRWNADLIKQGIIYLEFSASGTAISEYHIEAMIASIHARAKSVEETDWKSIVDLYNLLLEMKPSPVVALNRAIALAQWQGPERGLEAIAAIEDRERLNGYPFYWAAQGEFESRRGRLAEARTHFHTALSLARSPMERRFLQGKLSKTGDPAPPRF